MSSPMNEQSNPETPDGVVLTPEQARSRRARNIAIGVTVALLAVLFYAITVVRLGGAVANRAL
jgi:hypothetical protein